MRSLATVSEGWLARVSAALTLAAMWSDSTMAHHSFASIYDGDRTVTLAATVQEFQFIHPHPFLIVEVRNDKGERQSWRAEMDNRFELEGIGVTRSTFKPGDKVTVSGSPGRSQEFILYLWRLDRPADRLRYRQTGNTPSLHRMPAGTAGD